MSKYLVQMCCISAQPTAAADGATAGGARVVLTQRVTSGDPGKGARLELFLGQDDKESIKLGDVLTLELR